MPAIIIPAAGDEIVSAWGSQVATNVNGLALPPGVELPAGATVAGVLAGSEIFVGAPVAGSDPSGYYVAASKRLTIPAALGGLYLLTAFGTATGGTAGNARRVTVVIGGVFQNAGSSVGAGGGANYWSTSVICQMPGGSAIIFTASAVTTAADFAVSRAQLYRIGLSG